VNQKTDFINSEERLYKIEPMALKRGDLVPSALLLLVLFY
jgi:hypothetical protein